MLHLPAVFYEILQDHHPMSTETPDLRDPVFTACTWAGHWRKTIVTWLILPAIICLSQRLSHACLSISDYTAKLRMAHYISYNLLD